MGSYTQQIIESRSVALIVYIFHCTFFCTIQQSVSHIYGCTINKPATRRSPVATSVLRTPGICLIGPFPILIMRGDLLKPAASTQFFYSSDQSTRPVVLCRSTRPTAKLLWVNALAKAASSCSTRSIGPAASDTFSIPVKEISCLDQFLYPNQLDQLL